GFSREFASVVGFPTGENDAPVLRADGGFLDAKDFALCLPPPRLAAERSGQTTDVADLEGNGHSWAGIYTLVIPSAARDPLHGLERLRKGSLGAARLGMTNEGPLASASQPAVSSLSAFRVR